jgi:hypothetical protein
MRSNSDFRDTCEIEHGARFAQVHVEPQTNDRVCLGERSARHSEHDMAVVGPQWSLSIAWVRRAKH